MNSKRLAICAFFENEARLLPEWLAYHHLVGVDHFVLYDNGSTDESALAIHGSPVAEHCTLIRWPQRPGRVPAYRHFIDIFAPGFEWVAFVDVDQFLVPLGSRSVLDTLDWLSSAAAVLVQRRVFAPGAWPAEQLAIEAFRRRALDSCPVNRQVRAIVRCSDLVDVTQQPHEFQLKGQAFNTAGHLAPNRAVLDQPCFQNLVINQYCVRPGPSGLSKLLNGDDATALADAAMVAALGEQHDDAIQALALAVRHLLGLEVVAASPVEAPGFSPVAAETADLAVARFESEGTEPSIASAVDQPVTDQHPLVAEQLAPATGQLPPVTQQVPPLTEQIAAVTVEIAPGWTEVVPDGQQRAGGLALVFRDRSRPGDHWLAALRGAAANATDPAFLLDEFERIQDFPSDAAARAACDAVLAKGH